MLGFLKRYFELRYQRRIQTLKRGAEAFCKKYFSPQSNQECRLHDATVNASLGNEHAESFQEKTNARANRVYSNGEAYYNEDYNEEKHYSISVSEAVETPKVKHTEASNVRYSISTSTSYAGHDIDFSKLSQYLDDSRSDSFVERLLRLMREKELRAPSVYRAANISKQLYSKMISNLYYQPSRDTAIALAFALRLTFEQAQDFIGRAGFQLTHSDERDVILEFFFKEKYYKLLDINVVLHEMGKKPLGY